MSDVVEKSIKEQIDDLSHYDMGYLLRFAPAGHPFFKEGNYEYFRERFEELGGMTPELSKRLGWAKPQDASYAEEQSEEVER